ncbi:MAG: AGE family epimerase/isomerase [Halobacteriales archaeon]
MDGTFRDPWVLDGAIRDVLSFWYPESIDHRHGGYVLQRDEVDGHVYDGAARHLVGTCRAVFNFSVGALRGGPDWCREAAGHGLRFLLGAHRDHERGGFDWLLEGREPVDRTRRCYGHAFALLAVSTAARAGVAGAAGEIPRIYDLMEERFFEPEHSLYRIELDADWEPVSEYRGQNDNMHACEAALAAHRATGEDRYLDRAHAVAEALVRERAEGDGGLLWEHYTVDWEVDVAYNRDQPEHRFRPWGYQPGHLAEWAKLLARLARHRDDDWIEDRAVALFGNAVELGWDDDHGGMVYTVDREGEPIVEDKFAWPVTEAIGAAARLADLTGEERYWEWYDRLWAYAREHLINPKYGTWYRRLTPEGERIEREASPTVEPWYHPVSNAYEAIEVLEGE